MPISSQNLTTINLFSSRFDFHRWKILQFGQTDLKAAEATLTPTAASDQFHGFEIHIRQYQELIKNNAFIDAVTLYRVKLHDPLFYQFSDYKLIIKLLQPFFADNFTDVTKISDINVTAFLYLAMSRCLALLGELPLAETLLGKHNRIRQKLNDEERFVDGVIDLARWIQFPMQQTQLAEENLEFAFRLASKRQRIQHLIHAGVGLAEIYISQNQSDLAASYLNRAEALARGYINRESLSLVYGMKATLLSKQQDPFRALGISQRGTRLLDGIDIPFLVINSQIFNTRCLVALLLQNRILSVKEKQLFEKQAEQQLLLILKSASRYGIASFQIDGLVELLKFRFWQYTQHPVEYQSLQPEFIPLANAIWEIIEDTQWRVKLPEIKSLLEFIQQNRSKSASAADSDEFE